MPYRNMKRPFPEDVWMRMAYGSPILWQLRHGSAYVFRLREPNRRLAQGKRKSIAERRMSAMEIGRLSVSNGISAGLHAVRLAAAEMLPSCSTSALIRVTNHAYAISYCI